MSLLEIVSKYPLTADANNHLNDVLKEETNDSKIDAILYLIENGDETTLDEIVAITNPYLFKWLPDHVQYLMESSVRLYKSGRISLNHAFSIIRQSKNESSNEHDRRLSKFAVSIITPSNEDEVLSKLDISEWAHNNTIAVAGSDNAIRSLLGRGVDDYAIVCNALLTSVERALHVFSIVIESSTAFSAVQDLYVEVVVEYRRVGMDVIRRFAKLVMEKYNLSFQEILEGYNDQEYIYKRLSNIYPTDV